MLISLLFSCEKSEKETLTPDESISSFNLTDDGAIDYLYKTVIPSLEKKGITIESACNKEKIIVVNGRSKERLWLGTYNYQKKEKIFEWTDTKELPQTVQVHLGYGEYKKVDVKNLYATFANSESVFFISTFLHPYINGRGFHYVIKSTIFKDGLLVGSYKELLPNDATQWYNNSILVSFRNLIEHKTEYRMIYDTVNLNFLFTISDKIRLPKDIYTVNTEEIINFSPKTNTIIKRVNVKEGQEVWAIEGEKIPSDSKIDSTVLKKSGDIWTFTVKYTLYNGIKKEKKYTVNIKTGKIE